MATTHLKDIVAAVATYTDRNGNEKKQWKNIGKLLRNDNGEFMVLDRTFNPAGMPGDGDVFLSMFDPKPRDGQQSNAGATGNYDAPPNRDLDSDSIPF